MDLFIRQLAQHMGAALAGAPLVATPRYSYDADCWRLTVDADALAGAERERVDDTLQALIDAAAWLVENAVVGGVTIQFLRGEGPEGPDGEVVDIDPHLLGGGVHVARTSLMGESSTPVDDKPIDALAGALAML